MKKLFSFCFWALCIPFLVQAESSLPSPNLEVDVPMRDGKRLSADVYLPDNASRDLPCVLVRTPYGRRSHAHLYAPLKDAGYAVVIQDMRTSEGEEVPLLPYETDGWGSLQDGRDTVDWISSQGFSNGKVGTVGASALGISQLLMAPTRPEGLCCQYIQVATPSLYDHAICPSGCLRKSQVEGWLKNNYPDALSEVLSHIEAQDWWDRFNVVKRASEVQIPAVHYGGWFDTFSEGTIESFVAWQNEGGDGARGNQKLVIGPWTHLRHKEESLGDFSFPKNEWNLPWNISPKEWFDHHLKGEENGISQVPPVTYFVMGPLDGSESSGNQWRTASSWPVPSEAVPFFFSSKGELVNELESEEGHFVYHYDPQSPTPTIGGRNLILETGPRDQRSLESREDVVVFTSNPLEEDLEVTGKVKGTVHFSTSAKSTDVVLRLCDVYPDGKSVLIADGIAPVRRLEGEEGLKEVEVDLWSTSMVFAKGHKIRVSVSSANYPRYERSSEEADNDVLVGRSHPSHILLPVVKG